MFSRSTAFGVGATITLVAVAIGFVAPERAKKTSGIEGRNSPAGISVVSRTAEISGDDQFPFRSLVTIHELLARQRELGPAERESEDEIRTALAKRLSDENAEAILRGLRPDELSTEFGMSALSRWASRERMAAALWLADQPTQSNEQTWVIAQALAADPVGVEVLGQVLPVTSWREKLLENSSRASLPDNPDNAVRFAYRMQTGSARTRLLAGIADEWAMRDPDAAARWIAAEPDVSLRDELLFSGAVARASFDPASALDWANGISSDATYRRTLDKIASTWTDSSTEPTYRGAVLAALGRGIGPKPN